MPSAEYANFNDSTLTWNHDASGVDAVTLKLRNWNETQNERPMADVTASSDTARVFMAGMAGEKEWTTELIWQPEVNNAAYDDWETWVRHCGAGDLIFNFPATPCDTATVKLTCEAWLKGYEITGELDEAFIVNATWSIKSVSVGTGP